MPAIRVRAIRRAFYYGMRQPGQVFTIHDESALGSWMELVDQADIDRLGDKLGKIKKDRGIKPAIDPTKLPPTPAQMRVPIGPPAATPAATSEPGSAERAAAEKAAADAKAREQANDL